MFRRTKANFVGGFYEWLLNKVQNNYEEMHSRSDEGFSFYGDEGGGGI